MNITILAVGKIKEKYFTDALREYSKRMSRFAKFNIIEVPDEKIPDNPSEKEITAVKEKEGALILSRLPKNAYTAAMCVEGDLISSEELAEKISAATMSASHIAFIIGGSLGLSDEVKRRADIRISFGRITLPHQLMRVVLAEQIYRAFKINANESYHK
ncbi:MAG: 23S rRNA (pseudouridine(1915)-N(3))-methyltransferase RlmH [Firmicutes bacterium]|nr:23S rRNA (pseudouridine(1915)-N(3))-methyltransferase RlmH [Bacillota bacterium]